MAGALGAPAPRIGPGGAGRVQPPRGRAALSATAVREGQGNGDAGAPEQLRPDAAAQRAVGARPKAYFVERAKAALAVAALRGHAAYRDARRWHGRAMG